MRDGTTLYSDMYRPDVEGRFPVLLHRTPYNKDDVALGIGLQVHPVHAANRGYVVIVQDVRGRYASQGEFDPFTNEASDGYDTVEWAANLPFSNGKVGMFGGSYTGVTQIQATSARPPHLVAISPRETGSNYYEGWTYQGGAFLLGFNFLWSALLAMDEAERRDFADEKKETIFKELASAADNLQETCSKIPLEKISIFRKYQLARYFYDWLRHEKYDEFWKKIDAKRHYGQMNVAGLHIAGWYDIFLKGSIENYVGLASRKNSRRKQRLIIGPWVHGTEFPSLVGEWNFGLLSEGGMLPIEEMQFEWFEYWLKGAKTNVLNEAPVMIFVMGENKWRTESEWPLARTQYTDFYLHSGGSANTFRGDGTLTTSLPQNEIPDSYVYDSLNPVPTRGGATTGAYHAELLDGVYDQRQVESRGDVLVYTSQKMDEDWEVTGPVRLLLWASSSALDTDFTAKLVDVHPDGYARNLCDGIIRARHRNLLQEPELLEPGVTYKFNVDLTATSNVFKKGHRLRVEVSSSNFPRFDRNFNTDHTHGADVTPKEAKQTIYHDIRRPSHLVLPIVPPHS